MATNKTFTGKQLEALGFIRVDEGNVVYYQFVLNPFNYSTSAYLATNDIEVEDFVDDKSIFYVDFINTNNDGASRNLDDNTIKEIQENWEVYTNGLQ